MSTICSAPGCAKPRRRREFCGMHYARLARIGQLEYDIEDDGLDWRPIPEFEEYYEASSTGVIRRAAAGQRTWRGKVLSFQVNRYGYHQLTLTVGNKHFTRSVHVLVCAAFHGPRPEGRFACHVNDEKSDNRPANLYWGTPADNNRDAVLNGKNHQAIKTHCLRGHEFTPENTYSKVRPDGRRHRRCRECIRITQRAARKASYVASADER